MYKLQLAFHDPTQWKIVIGKKNENYVNFKTLPQLERRLSS